VARQAAMLTVSELKQFIYCPRIFYFSAIQPLRPPTTRLMDRGQQLQEDFERLEPRRVLCRYGLQEAHRYFSLPLSDPELGLAGQVDLLLEAADRLAVVEFKASGGSLAENHRYQLAAYALLAECSFQKPCPAGFALFVDRAEIEEVPIDEGLRRAVRVALGEMTALLQLQDFPPPTPASVRCTNCEFRNFCGDVF
jgi:CRISPR-associated exonuclease Cas4